MVTKELDKELNLMKEVLVIWQNPNDNCEGGICKFTERSQFFSRY
jgi:hypothetical protein